ncbi:hypothetical protein AB7813_12635 [Tardiphaga sp. 20_F10_N6_6]|uniref:hypothetical protein n=1 Tax=Tardiphaga sp. 20_F10_N6_6 TaxID=3240788 RepID=UPI003F8BEEBA
MPIEVFAMMISRVPKRQHTTGGIASGYVQWSTGASGALVDLLIKLRKENNIGDRAAMKCGLAQAQVFTK